MGLFDGGDSSGIMGMLSGLFPGQGQAADAPVDPNAAAPGAPMQILPQAQQSAMAGPSFLDTIKAGLAKNPGALNNLAMQYANQKPAPVPALPPINFPSARQPAYGSLVPSSPIGGR